MDKYESQRRIFIAAAILMLVSVAALIAVIPVLLREFNSGSLPKEASMATSAGAGIHLLLFIGFIIGSRLAKLHRRINREVNLASAIVLLIVGLIIMDGAFAYLGSLNIASMGMFLCVGCDIAAAIVAVVAYYRLRPVKESLP